MAQKTSVPLSSIQNVQAVRLRDESVCLKAFDLDAVKSVCYRFAAEGYHTLSIDDHAQFARVTFRFSSTITAEAEEALIDRFHQALLDQDLRQSVAKKTELARQLILANAFADTAVVDRDDF